MKLVFTVLLLLVIASITIGGAFAFTSANDFSRNRLNDGIAVGAPDNWRWVRDGIHIDDFIKLAGDPRVNHAAGLTDGELGKMLYDSNIPNAQHEFLFDEDGFLRFPRWYKGLKGDNQTEAPEPTISDGLTVAYPRMVPISWLGESAYGFEVEVEIMYPDGEWALSNSYYTSQNSVVHQHTGANAGRWRVRLLTAKGGGSWSEYVQFKCIQ